MKYCLALVLLCLIACTAPVKKNSVAAPVGAKPIDTSMYHVMKFDKTRDSSFFGADNQPADLSYDDIVKIEKLIAVKVAAYNRDQQKEMDDNHRKAPDNGQYELIDHPEKYYKQFLPVINSKRQKEVWVLCFCSPEEKIYWKKLMITVFGGGYCFFQVELNLTTNTILQFNVNAPK